MAITVKTRWWEVFPREHKIYDGGELVASAMRIDFGNESETFAVEDKDGNRLGTLLVKLRMDFAVKEGESPFVLSLNKKKIEGKFANADGHTSFKYGRKEYLIRWPKPTHPRENLQYIEVSNGDNVVAKATMDIRVSWERSVEIESEFKEAKIPLALVLGRKVGFVASEYIHNF